MTMRLTTIKGFVNLSCRYLLAAVAAAWALCACSLDDSRDLCCLYAAAMVYSYKPYGAEAFDEHILSLRHFLFQRNGHFISELPAGDDLKYQPLSLPEGEYTMVTVGNAGEYSQTNHGEVPHLSGFGLQHVGTHSAAPDALKNTDELYWGVRDFSVDDEGLLIDPVGRTRISAASPLTTYMNNIHCHLTVKVEWSNVPEHIGTYEMELDGVPAAYSLDPDEAADADGFIVPVHSALHRHRLCVGMQAHELNGEFVTLRYTDEAIPVLRLRFAGQQVGPDIDLKRAFNTWGWRPSAVHVQKYAIKVRMHRNGTAELTPLVEASVEDWVDGGSFG